MRTFIPFGLLLTVLSACSANVETSDVDAVLDLDGDAVTGQALYVEHCERCHAADGTGVNAASFPELVPGAPDADLDVATLGFVN